MDGRDRIGWMYVVGWLVCVAGLLAIGGLLQGCESEEVGSSVHEASLQAIGPAKEFAVVQAGDGQVGAVLPDGSVMSGHRDPGKRSVPWALSPAEQMAEMPDMVRATHGAMDHKEHFFCGQGILDRAYATGRPVSGTIRWSMYLRWQTAKGRMEVVGVEFGDAPPAVDAEARHCYAEAYRGISVPVDDVPERLRTGGFFTEWTSCVTSAQEVAK